MTDKPINLKEEIGNVIKSHVNSTQWWETESNQILSLFSSYIKGVENPYPSTKQFNDERNGFETCRNLLLKLLERGNYKVS